MQNSKWLCLSSVHRSCIFCLWYGCSPSLWRIECTVILKTRCHCTNVSMLLRVTVDIHKQFDLFLSWHSLWMSSISVPPIYMSCLKKPMFHTCCDLTVWKETCRKLLVYNAAAAQELPTQAPSLLTWPCNYDCNTVLALPWPEQTNSAEIINALMSPVQWTNVLLQ